MGAGVVVDDMRLGSDQKARVVGASGDSVMIDDDDLHRGHVNASSDLQQCD